MKIDLAKQIHIDPALPAGPLRGFTGSALLVELSGIPATLAGGAVEAVAVSLVTPDGLPLSANAEKAGDVWRALFAASNLTGYGWTRNGFKATATVRMEDGSAHPCVLGVGNLGIDAGTPNAQPADPSRAYVTKGDEVYVKSRVVESVQHYVKQVMEYDADIGWGATWTGDYILVNGEFTEAEAGQ